MANIKFPEAKRLISTVKMDREEWLKVRQSGIGGSEIASLLGINPWSSPIKVWQDKLGQAEEIKPNYQMRLGSLAEDAVAQIWAEDNPDFKVERINSIMQSLNNKIFLANIDRIAWSVKDFEPIILEIKNISGRGAGKWYGEEPPYYYQAQVQWYLGVTGLKKGKLIANIANNEMLEFDIERDEEVISKMFEVANDFWQKNVLNKEMPAPIGNDSDIFSTIFDIASNPEGTDLTAHKGLFERRGELKTQIDELASEMKGIENTIKVELGEFKFGTIEGKKAVSVSKSTRNTLDSKKVQADHPELFEKYSKQTEVVTYRFN